MLIVQVQPGVVEFFFGIADVYTEYIFLMCEKDCRLWVFSLLNVVYLIQNEKGSESKRPLLTKRPVQELNNLLQKHEP